MAKYVRADEMARMLDVHVEAVPWYLAYMRTKIFGKAKQLGISLR
jgi:hypothetical protein